MTIKKRKKTRVIAAMLCAVLSLIAFKLPSLSNKAEVNAETGAQWLNMHNLQIDYVFSDVEGIYSSDLPTDGTTNYDGSVINIQNLEFDGEEFPVTNSVEYNVSLKYNELIQQQNITQRAMLVLWLYYDVEPVTYIGFTIFCNLDYFQSNNISLIDIIKGQNLDLTAENYYFYSLNLGIVFSDNTDNVLEPAIYNTRTNQTDFFFIQNTVIEGFNAESYNNIENNNSYPFSIMVSNITGTSNLYEDGYQTPTNGIGEEGTNTALYKAQLNAITTDEGDSTVKYLYTHTDNDNGSGYVELIADGHAYTPPLVNYIQQPGNPPLIFNIDEEDLELYPSLEDAEQTNASYYYFDVEYASFREKLNFLIYAYILSEVSPGGDGNGGTAPPAVVIIANILTLLFNLTPFGWIYNIIQGIISAIKDGLFDPIKQFLIDPIQRVAEAITNFLGSFFNSIGKIFDELPDLINPTKSPFLWIGLAVLVLIVIIIIARKKK